MNDNNTKEVSDERVESYNNDIRMKGSVQPEPMRGSGDYNFAKPHALDAADTGGVVGVVTMSGSNMGMEGNYAPSLNSNVDVHNSDTSLNTTYSHVNESAKYKYPNVKQDIDPLDNPKVAFNDHS